MQINVYLFYIKNHFMTYKYLYVDNIQDLYLDTFCRIGSCDYL